MPAETNADSLNALHSLPGVVRFDAGQGGLIRAVITTPHADAEVYLHGAHVTAYNPRNNRPVLWVSAKSHYTPGKPIRGGVPIIFPWFGPRADNPTSPAHGFARTKLWQVESTQSHHDGSAQIVLALHHDPQTVSTWPHPFTLRYRIRVGHSLELSLNVTNTGSAEFTFEEALHSYFSVGDVSRISVDGLSGATYIDKVAGGVTRTQTRPRLMFTGETDSVYQNTPATCTIDDPALARRISIAKEASLSTVVWNPWIAKAKAMADFGDNEWPTMLCIESANVGDHRITLPSGSTHSMRCKVTALA